MIQELIQTLSPQERTTLAQKAADSDSSLFKFIKAVMDDPEITKEQLQKQFGINENTYFKNLSLAKDEIYEVIKQHLVNSYDELLLTNVLYRRGLDVHASKLRLKLESEYDKLGWWNVLNELHSLDMMVAYAKCDIPRLQAVKDKALKNAERHLAYVRVDREVIVQMAIIEKGDLKEKDFDSYAQKMTGLLRQARQTGHHIPVFNALHSLFVLYTKYKTDLRRASDILTEMLDLITTHGDKMIPFTINAAWLNVLSFHVEYLTKDNPQNYVKKVDDAIGRHGLLYDTEAIIAFCTWHFLSGDKSNFNKRLDQFNKMPTERALYYKQAYLLCLRAYMQGDTRAFSQHLNEFYSHDTSREYNDHDLMLRYLELLILIGEKDYALASSKMEAAMKFVRRNFTSYRVDIEKKNWDMLRAAIQGKAVKQSTGATFRLTPYIYEALAK